MLFIGKPMGRSIMISNGGVRYFSGGVSYFSTNPDSQWNPIYNAFHRIFRPFHELGRACINIHTLSETVSSILRLLDWS